MFVDLVLRWIHILSAMILVGGTFFLRFSLAPTLQAQSHELQQSLLTGWRPRWAKLVMLTSGLLLVSGLVNAVRIIIAYKFSPDGAPYHALVAVKLLLAMAIFWISAVLSGRSSTAEKFRGKMSFWLNVNVILTVLIVALAGYMKMIPREVKPADSTVQAARMP